MHVNLPSGCHFFMRAKRTSHGHCIVAILTVKVVFLVEGNHRTIRSLVLQSNKWTISDRGHWAAGSFLPWNDKATSGVEVLWKVKIFIGFHNGAKVTRWVRSEEKKGWKGEEKESEHRVTNGCCILFAWEDQITSPEWALAERVHRSTLLSPHRVKSSPLDKQSDENFRPWRK